VEQKKSFFSCMIQTQKTIIILEKRSIMKLNDTFRYFIFSI